MTIFRLECCGLSVGTGVLRLEWCWLEGCDCWRTLAGALWPEWCGGNVVAGLLRMELFDWSAVVGAEALWLECCGWNVVAGVSWLECRG